MGPDLMLKSVTNGLLEGRITPFLGAGVNLCHRPDEFKWNPAQQDYLPNGSELAVHLGDKLCEDVPLSADLARIAQLAEVTRGSEPLYVTLREIFDRDYPPTRVHRFFAELPGRVRAKGRSPRYLLHVTTNYDDVLERAFAEAGEPYDTLVYLTDGPNAGKFIHAAPGEKSHLIDIPNEYAAVSPDKRSVILKIHGAVERDPGQTAPVSEPKPFDSFVITEDHYIDYLARPDSGVLPPFVGARLQRSGLLYLGYGLRDWNLRVVLRRLTAERPLSYTSWAVQRDPDRFDSEIWRRRNVRIIDHDLEAYMAALSGQLDAALVTSPRTGLGGQRP